MFEFFRHYAFIACLPATLIVGCGSPSALSTILRAPAGPISRNSFEIGSLAFASDGRGLVAPGVELLTHGICSYRLNRDGPHEFSRFGGHDQEFYAVTATDDGNLVAAGGDHGVLYVWDGTTGRLLRGVQAHSGRITSASFSSDGSLLATIGADSLLRIWKSRSDDPVTQTIGSGRRFTEVKLSPDGTRVAVTVPGVGCSVMETIDGTPIHEFDIKYPTALAFSPAGDVLAVGEHGGVSVWNLMTGKRLHRFSDDFASIYGVAFSASGLDLIAAGRSGNVWVYDLERGQLAHSFDVRTRVMHVALAADGKSAAICVGGQEVRFVDLSDSTKSSTLLRSR